MVTKIKTQRSFIIGDQWLYYKIYTGFKTSDVILTEIIKPITTELLKNNLIDKWFYIRYSDPKNHLRIRFHCSENKNIFEVINKLNPYLKEYLMSDLIWNIQIDTYQREIERYGENTIELSEELFFHDSNMIVEFIDLIEGEEGEEIRWLFCLKAINKFLDDFRYSNREKLNLLENLKIGYANEFDLTKAQRIQVNSKYRNNRKIIEDFMLYTIKDNEKYIEIEDLLSTKSDFTANIIKKIIDINKNETLNLNSFVSSHIHMLTNRLFKSKGRLNEMVVYDFLYRYIDSIEARNKQRI
ncbi:thiopeptide-type bacteriocin biosynthesis protein [Flavobacterium sp. LS1R49]|uniref:Thiopeptide-type bacteriocin biosynthesis protein n=1 Tax=Flavobacterium shii TaxID=2987687 RepID=A0A9X2ZF40_9FLAO|nr:thiopeptide-type bacteriocin biosynthesis protein [Flavobacterium shii]MCV9926528.1 thiopeptide-type bacteriocin biosynthesis protein [Flavobacterium shii]